MFLELEGFHIVDSSILRSSLLGRRGREAPDHPDTGGTTWTLYLGTRDHIVSAAERAISFWYEGICSLEMSVSPSIGCSMLHNL